jgi:hypothetical protein
VDSEKERVAATVVEFLAPLGAAAAPQASAG